MKERERDRHSLIESSHAPALLPIRILGVPVCQVDWGSELMIIPVVYSSADWYVLACITKVGLKFLFPPPFSLTTYLLSNSFRHTWTCKVNAFQSAMNNPRQ